MRIRHIIISIITLLGVIQASGQIVPIRDEAKINADSVRRAFDKGPYFGLYKDNYFIFGPAIGQR